MSSLYVEDIDEDLWNLLDADHRSKKEIVHAALWEHFGGRKKSALEAKLRHKREQMQAIEHEIEAEKEDRDRVQQEIEAIEGRLEELDGAAEEYEDDLDDLLDAAEAGERDARIIPATLSDLADRHGESPEQVHEDLKQRAIDQERAVSAKAFVQAMHDADVPHKPVADVWGDADE